MSLLEQPSLVQDYLTPYAEYIRHIVRHDDYILNQVLIWAIIHWIPLRQFHENDLDVIFYENACLNPVAEISHILANKGATETIDIDESTIRRPSRMAGAESTVQQGVLPLNLWREQMSAAQVRVGREILAEFGLTDLYGDDSSPNESELQRLLQTSG